jgi:type I site-specific restriction endonuclease
MPIVVFDLNWVGDSRGTMDKRSLTERDICTKFILLYYKPNIPIALIEAKDNNHSVGHGIQQGLDYAATLDIPFVFSSNGDGFVFHDRTGLSVPVEANLDLDAFPSPADLWAPSTARVRRSQTTDPQARIAIFI